MTRIFAFPLSSYFTLLFPHTDSWVSLTMHVFMLCFQISPSVLLLSETQPSCLPCSLKYHLRSYACPDHYIENGAPLSTPPLCSLPWLHFKNNTYHFEVYHKIYFAMLSINCSVSFRRARVFVSCSVIYPQHIISSCPADGQILFNE